MNKTYHKIYFHAFKYTRNETWEIPVGTCLWLFNDYEIFITINVHEIPRVLIQLDRWCSTPSSKVQAILTVLHRVGNHQNPLELI